MAFGSPVPATGKLSCAVETRRYTYSWSTTKSLANTCQLLVLQLKDGSQHRVDVSFEK